MTIVTIFKILLFALNLASLGYVPHCDMMQFIAMASSGAYLAKAPPVSTD